MIKVYIASTYELQSEAARIKRLLELKDKFQVTSRWITDETSKDPSDAYLRDWAQKDLSDVNICDILMALNPYEYRNKGTGGRHVELGYAIALQIPILLYGEKSNIFHNHPLVTHLESPGDFIKSLEKIYFRYYSHTLK